jgi:hypothetical protein
MRSLSTIILLLSALAFWAWSSPPTSNTAQDTLTGPELVLRSIRYHDPQGQWLRRAHEFSLKETRGDGTFRTTELILNPGAGKFSLSQHRGEDHISRFLGPDNCVVTLNGKSTFTEEQKEKYRLTCAGSTLYRDYYTYLWGLPMKLQDEGTLIGKQVESVDFYGQQLLQVRVTYAEGVGEDVWYFYFHPITYALSGYRFYHDEAANDGEYILLEGEVAVGPLRLPAKRSWYTHGEGTYLGVDEVLP